MAACQTRTQLSRYCVMSYRNREKKAYLILTSFWQAYLSRFRLLPNQATSYSIREGSVQLQLD